ncbi:MAG TPA: LysE family transporter [Patescibacteria group bacterium]|nr:LysE family transporter [Patescibacteria group bacterium]
MFAYFIQGLLLGFPAAATPGPLQAFFLSETMRVRWRRALPSALAPLISDLPIILLVLVILTRTPDWFLRIIRISGGLFLLYLATTYLTNYRRGLQDESPTEQPVRLSLFKAAMTNLLSPNPYFFWGIVAGPILLSALRESSSAGLSFVLGFYGTLIGGFVLFITLFAAGRRFAPRLISSFSLMAILALALFGIFQLYSGIYG